MINIQNKQFQIINKAANVVLMYVNTAGSHITLSRAMVYIGRVWKGCLRDWKLKSYWSHC